jgi:sulfur carrier protein
MLLTLNGKEHQFDGNTVSELIEQLGLQGRLAVEVNEDIVPKSDHATYPLSAGDVVEIVHAIGGG